MSQEGINQEEDLTVETMDYQHQLLTASAKTANTLLINHYSIAQVENAQIASQVNTQIIREIKASKNIRITLVAKLP